MAYITEFKIFILILSFNLYHLTNGQPYPAQSENPPDIFSSFMSSHGFGNVGIPSMNSQHQGQDPSQSNGGQYQPSYFGGQGSLGSQGLSPAHHVWKSMDQLYSDLFRPNGINPDDIPQVNIPDTSRISKSCSRNSFFYSMNPQHMQAVENVKDIIMSYNTTAERISISNALRNSKDVNLKVWYYALSGCSLNDPELQAIHKPSPIEIMPDNFINAETCNKAKGGQGYDQGPIYPGGPQQPGVYGPPQQPGVYGPPQQPGVYGPPQQPGVYGPQQQPGVYGPQQQPGVYGPQQQPDVYGPPQQHDVYGPPQQPDVYGPPHRKKRQASRCVVLDETVGADNGAENILWYFREDIQVNSHHWYWHLANPPASQVRQNRRGELFYYVHNGMLARYAAERLSNGLPPITAFQVGQAGVNIGEGYFAHLADQNSGQVWTDRRSNMPFTDIMHQQDPDLGINIIIRDHIITALNRIRSAIDQGIISTAQGQRISLLQGNQGIDLLGDIIQSTQWSRNPNFYGLGPAGLHNSGHVVFAECMDPLYRTRTPPGPMADTSTSMRDTIFFRWHTLINELFDRHKATLPPYTPTGGTFPLSWPVVQMVSISVQARSGGQPNQLQTFWTNRQFPFNRGLDFARPVNSQPINICAKYLDHGEFTYQIVVNNQNNAQSRATVRIFMAPRFDGQGNRYSMLAQRNLFFVMDTFSTNLVAGRNTIVRNSTANTLTIPWQQTITEQNQDVNQATPFCGCGWPLHLLLPKGTPRGMIFDLFVMLTDGNLDAVTQPSSSPRCTAAPLFCGIPNGRYPDARPMGYPFDRFPYQVNNQVVANLEAYEAGIPNIGAIQVTITTQAN